MVRTEPTRSKVPEVTLGGWIIKIAATALRGKGAGIVSMTMGLGYVAGTPRSSGRC